MNETDVREEIVRPLISRLGYKHGADAYVRTEISLKYEQSFLGRKNPSRDPDLRGRADYICGVTAAGKWVIEVKPPSQPITEEVIQQAHTYAAHPEIAAYFFVVTNGKEFRVFETGRLAESLLEWSFEETERVFLRILNLLGPDAIRARSKLVLADPDEPLGVGLRSTLRLIKGSVTYDLIEAPGLDGFLSSLQGIELPVTSGEVFRDPDGRIHASVSLASVSPLFRAAGAMGISDHYDFYSSSQYISINDEQPTIFQNLIETRIAQGSPTSMMGSPGFMPFGLHFAAFTEVVGFVRDGLFQGTMRVEGEMEIGEMSSLYAAIMRAQFRVVSGKYRVIQAGRFSAELIAGAMKQLS